MNTISVILPVVQVKMAEDLMLSMNRNTVLPTKVIVFDDSDFGFEVPVGLSYPVEYTRTERRAEVNVSLNEGIERSRSSDFVVVMNDDIIIHDRLFETIVKAFNDNPKFGVVCLNEIGTPEEVGCRRKSQYEILRMRQGAIIAFRKEALAGIPPVPKEIKRYFADDWWWNHIIRAGFLWGKILSSRIYHYGSTTFKQRGLEDLTQDKIAFMLIAGGRWRLPEEYR